ncbi:MAG: NAD(P)-binding domain-containing protein [Candidatus Acidiferrales bacterium]
MLEIAIVGAGPYGLSIAAHFRRRGIPFRIFGRAMDSWLAHMPKGMMLKSDGFASDIYDPNHDFTLRDFCAERKIEYSDAGIPVRLDTFAAYGLAFKERFVPELKESLVVSVERADDGFILRLEDGEIVAAKRVVLAVGITHFEYVPANLAHLPGELLSHSFHHHDLERFKGRSIVVIGGGSSAIDLAGLLKESGAEVTLVARRTALTFHTKSMGKPRSFWQRIRHPKSGIGPGMRSRFFANLPGAFHYLPERFRLKTVENHLGPSGGWFAKDKVIGRVPLLLGYTPEGAEIQDGKVRLTLRASDGAERELLAEHIIAATGYRVDLDRLLFLSTDIRKQLKAVNGTPVLSSTFESSMPGLYFVGIASANSFGPVMRFAFGAGFAARRLTRTMTKSISRARVSVRSVAAVPGEGTRAILEKDAMRRLKKVRDGEELADGCIGHVQSRPMQGAQTASEFIRHIEDVDT